MKKIIFTVLLIGSSHFLFAQYLHYWDNSRPRGYVVPMAKKSAPQEAPKPEPAPVVKEDPPMKITSPMKIDAQVLITGVTVAVNEVSKAPKFYRKPVIFHDWPDKCPAFTGALPVLNNYVPPEIALIITEKFEGHLYSISSYKGQDHKPQYKLKICSGGRIKYEYADAKGNVVGEEKKNEE